MTISSIGMTIDRSIVARIHIRWSRVIECGSVFRMVEA